MNLKEVNGTYGNGTPCTVLVAENRNGSSWYCVEDSANVNLTWDEINEGVDVETLHDVDTFNMSKGTVSTLDELENAINS